jgi:hypothetical protein
MGALPASPLASGVDVAFNGLGASKGKAYFFKDDQHGRVDWTSVGPDQEVRPIGVEPGRRFHHEEDGPSWSNAR